MKCKWDWIPVTEQLPTFDETTQLYPIVLVSLCDGRVVTGCYREDDEMWCCSDEDSIEIMDYNATGEVTAWMPFPCAYNGTSDGIIVEHSESFCDGLLELFKTCAKNNQTGARLRFELETCDFIVDVKFSAERKENIDITAKSGDSSCGEHEQACAASSHGPQDFVFEEFSSTKGE